MRFAVQIIPPRNLPTGELQITVGPGPEIEIRAIHLPSTYGEQISGNPQGTPHLSTQKRVQCCIGALMHGGVKSHT